MAIETLELKIMDPQKLINEINKIIISRDITELSLGTSTSKKPNTKIWHIYNMVKPHYLAYFPLISTSENTILSGFFNMPMEKCKKIGSLCIEGGFIDDQDDCGCYERIKFDLNKALELETGILPRCRIDIFKCFNINYPEPSEDREDFARKGVLLKRHRTADFSKILKTEWFYKED